MLLQMPAISTSALPSETARHVAQAYREVEAEPKVGIIEERYHGKVPVHIDRKPPYAGVTEIRPILTDNGLDVASVRMGISDSLPGYVKLINGKEINYKRRVAKHEARHVKSEKLTKYLDVDRKLGTLIMESYAEFGGMKANPKEKDEILLTTPYKKAVFFGIGVDKFYKSFRDGATGYAAFIRDIQRYKSASRAMYNLGRNVKEAMNRGINVDATIQAAYRNELKSAGTYAKAA